MCIRDRPLFVRLAAGRCARTLYAVSYTHLLRRCEDFDGSEAYLERLNEARSQIAAVQAEIDAINDEIREKL